MNNAIATPTTFTPYQYQPHITKIQRIPMSDGSFTYRHPVSRNEVETYQEDLFDLMTLSLNKLQMAIDLLSEDDYEKFGFVFGALLANTEKTYHEALHHIEKNVGDIQLTKIAHAQKVYVTDTVIDATLKQEV